MINIVGEGRSSTILKCSESLVEEITYGAVDSRAVTFKLELNFQVTSC